MEILLTVAIIIALVVFGGFGLAVVRGGGNVDDPYRDVGNGGMTERESVAQFIRERREAGRPLSEEELQVFRDRGEL